MLKSEKGMTLVSLLVAIVVLLALAGTVVYLVFGKNGVASNSPTMAKIQDRNYVESIVEVGLKAVRAQAEATPTNENQKKVPATEAEKMETLMFFLDNSEFSKETDSVLKYNNADGIAFRITVDFGNYKIKSIE